jgi:hypothetical protein
MRLAYFIIHNWFGAAAQGWRNLVVEYACMISPDFAAKQTDPLVACINVHFVFRLRRSSQSVQQ